MDSLGGIFMKIQEIKTHVIMQKLERPFGMSQWLWDSRASCLVEVITDDGIVGWGECFGPAKTNAALIQEVYAPLLIGENPLFRKKIWEILYNRTREFGRKGIVASALSGVDIALWDIFGKHVNQPISVLLGGDSDIVVESYASAFYYNGDSIPDEAQKLTEQGYQTFKMKVGGLSLAEDLKRVQEVRRSIGANAQLAVDANRAYTVYEAIKFGEMITNLDIAWFEEPVLPDDLQGYKEVRSALNIRIAGGESEFTRFGFRDFMENRGVDIVQPDVAVCGGLSEATVIGSMATTYGIDCFPHLWGSAISLAATLHLISAIPKAVPSQVRKHPLLELDQAPNVFRDKLSNLVPSPIMSIPDRPGLGIDIDCELIEFYELK